MAKRAVDQLIQMLVIAEVGIAVVAFAMTVDRELIWILILLEQVPGIWTLVDLTFAQVLVNVLAVGLVSGDLLLAGSVLETPLVDLMKAGPVFQALS